MSAKELRTKASTICDDMNRQFGHAFADFPKEPTPDQERTFYVRSVPIVERAVNRLSKLRPPSDLDAQFKQYLAAQRSGIAHAKAASVSAEAAHEAGKSEDPASAEANRIAKNLRLGSCAGG